MSELKIASTEPIDPEELTKTKSDAPAEEPAEEPVEEPVAESPTAKDEEVAAPEVPQKDEEAPPQPPRPKSPTTTMKQTLKEAFPSVDERVITGVLIASQGDLDLLFNALLYISDPSVEEPTIAFPPPKVAAAAAPIEAESDEALARRLQKEFEIEERRRRRRDKQRQRHQPEDDNDSPDEFEQIKETFSQGLEEARTTLNGWVSGLAKKFDNQGNAAPAKNPKLFGALGGSSAQKKFDEDPEILSSNFHEKINMNDNEAPPSLPKRKQDWNEQVPVNSDAFMVTDSEDEDKKEIKL